MNKLAQNTYRKLILSHGSRGIFCRTDSTVFNSTSPLDAPLCGPQDVGEGG
jgi:hypothetical protein